MDLLSFQDCVQGSTMVRNVGDGGWGGGVWNTVLGKLLGPYHEELYVSCYVSLLSLKAANSWGITPKFPNSPTMR